MKGKTVWLLVIALIILHQDNWLWYDARLVFGFMPIGLLYHAGISVAAGVTWYLATKFCWPAERELVGGHADAVKGSASQ